MNIPFFIGWRYTGTKQKNQLVSFLSRISIFGLIVGVALLILVLSIMNGFNRELRERILGLMPQVSIYHREGIDDWQRLREQINQHAGVVDSAPFVELSGLVSLKKEATPVVIYGVDRQLESNISRITDFVAEEAFEQLAKNEKNLILGFDVAKNLGVSVGEQVMLVVPNAQQRNGIPRVQYFNVVGLLKTSTEVDTTIVLTSLKNAALMSSTPDSVSGLHVKLHDLFHARAIAWDIILELGQGYYGNSWMNTHGNLYHAIQMSKNLVGLLMSLIVAIAAFNVVSTLIMVVVEKQGDIAILRTLGCSTRQIMMVFMVQGSLIGLIGTALGVGLGILLSLVVQDVVSIVETLFGIQFLRSDVYPITYLPTQIHWGDITEVALMAFFLSFLATIYPSWRASRVAPAEALRYE